MDNRITTDTATTIGFVTLYWNVGLGAAQRGHTRGVPTTSLRQAWQRAEFFITFLARNRFVTTPQQHQPCQSLAIVAEMGTDARLASPISGARPGRWLRSI